MRNVWPLIGRDDVLATLRRQLDPSTPRSIVLAGAPGVGKTRLARECLRVAESKGFATAVVTASSSATNIPFGALAPLLVGWTSDEPTSPSAYASMLRRAGSALLRSAEGRPLMLFVDDGHALDEASATLVHQLSVSAAATIVMTVLAGRPTPTSVVAIWKDGYGDRIEIPALTGEQTATLIRSAFVDPVDGAAVARLAEASQGNALYLRELIVGAEANGRLVNEHGIWRLTGPLALSERLVELIESRLQALSSDQRDVLEIVAFAQKLHPSVLRMMCGGNLVAATELERRHLLVSNNDYAEPSVRLAHPLYSDVVKAATPVLRTIEIARRLAEIAERDGITDEARLLEVGMWRLIAGGASAQILVSAARIARWRFDFPLAERLARAASDAGAGYEAHLLLAQLTSLQGDTARGDELMAALARGDLDDDKYLHLTLLRMESAAFHAGSLEVAESIAAEALTKLDRHEHKLEIAARRTTITFAREGPRTTAAVAQPMLKQTRGGALIWCSMAASQSAACMGELTAAIDAAEQGFTAQHALGESRAQWYPCFHVTQKCDALNHWGKFDEARSLSISEYQRALDDRSPEAQAAFALQLSKGVADCGGMSEAARFAREAANIFESLNRPQFELWSRQYLTLSLALEGHADEATIALADLDALAVPVNHVMVADRSLARAWERIAHGDVQSAVRILSDAAAVALRSGDKIGEAAILHTLCRVGAQNPSIVVRLSKLADEVEGDMVCARSFHVTALARGDAESLQRCAQRFADLGAYLLAAEAAADAAQTWHRAGRHASAVASSIRSSALADKAGNPQTPALAKVARENKLTPAERSVAVMVARGATNRDVAAELQISVRTVESHLQHTYSKLHISRRSELVSALGLDV